ncbi:MAG: hypothetical protein JO322_10875 [Candidatus Eremiobacteraeota bacterium]|nr:hypothetical protein [Candidatus Eremiobacteraeota bacterium]
MNDRVFGLVINLNAYGATVRLESGELASAPAGDVEAHRTQYERSISGRKSIPFVRHPGSRRPMVTIAPQIEEPELDEQIAEYFKSTESWETDEEGRPAHERHFLRKKKRAALFQSKHSDET